MSQNETQRTFTQEEAQAMHKALQVAHTALASHNYQQHAFAHGYISECLETLQALATPQAATEPASQPATGRYVVEIDPPGEMFTFSKIRDMQTGMLLDGVYLDEAEAQTEADRLNAGSTGQGGE